MSLLGYECRLSMQACIDTVEGCLHKLPMPFNKKHGVLLSTLMRGARYWCTAEAGPGKPKLYGVPAAKHHAVLISKAAAGTRDEQLMHLGPFVQLLESEMQVEIRKLIEKAADKGPARKRLGSKASLGLLAAKRDKSLVASAAVSSSSGSKMKIDLFDM